jgi:phosphopentomutase
VTDRYHGGSEAGAAPASGPGTPVPRSRKVVLIVCDSLGVGEAPDAGDYGDRGADTAGHAAAAVGGLDLPTLGSWGFGRLTRIAGVNPVDPAAAVVGRMAER